MGGRAIADLETAPNEKRQEKKVEEVRRPEPNRQIKRHHSSSLRESFHLRFECPVVKIVGILV
jgi:hypothetical protein